MPLYEYQCQECGHRFETIQRFSDEPLKKCPECGGSLEKLISAPAFQFKGAGWYVTDYAKKSGGKVGEGGTSEKEGTAAKSDAGDKSESSSSKDGAAKESAEKAKPAGSTSSAKAD